MYSINCLTIPAYQQRYNTLGDYWTEGGVTQFRVASFGNGDYEFLIFIHEVVEKQLARKMGVTEQQIDAWDLSHEDVEEPGELENCPYREAHLRAEAIERVVATDLGVDWADYEKACREVMVKLQNTEPAPDTHPPRNNYGRKPPTAKARKRSVLRENIVMGMKPPMNETPMRIKNASNFPKTRENRAGVKNESSSARGTDNTDMDQPIKNSSTRKKRGNRG
jgi:hypothetical protein